jgi:DNA-binding NarL/FixJ family response regulator
MFTTFFDRELECQALEAGASGFLLKSYDVQEVVRLIIAATEGREGAGLFSSWSRQPRIKSQTSLSVAAPKMPRSVPAPRPLGFIRAFFAVLPQSRT